MAMKIDPKFKGKVTCDFKNDMRNLANMHRLKYINSKFNKNFYTFNRFAIVLRLINK